MAADFAGVIVLSGRWLILDLCAPLMAFGGVAIDHVGPTRDYPAASMLTGLFGNALGWHWSDTAAHQALQDRLIFAASIQEEGRLITDNQNARLYETEKGWTTHCAPEGREKSPSYSGKDETDKYYLTDRRRRDYLADARVLVVLRLKEGPVPPTLDQLAASLNHPARPLVIGRKPCVPSRPLFAGWCQGATAHVALAAFGTVPNARAQWPEGDGPAGDQTLELADLRNWRSGLHGGSRVVVHGRLPKAAP